MIRKKRQLNRFTWAIVCLLGVASLAHACSVPVFRYALERWPADKFEAIIFHRGPLSADHQKLIERLNSRESAANVVAEAVDLDQNKDPELHKVWETFGTEQLPGVLLFFPRTSRIPVPAWSGPLDEEAINTVVDSPARRQIARRLIKGETAVWVFLEIGDKAADDAAFKTLETELHVQQNKIKLGEIDEADLAQGLLLMDPEELKVKFSTLRISREEAKEKAFVEMLLGTESDLRELKEPMAFPIFGRGRALYALIGKGINADTIAQAGTDLTGPCTCTIKDQNPGTDMLMSVAWETLIEPFVEVEKELPPLKGLGGFGTEQAKDDDDKSEENDGQTAVSAEASKTKTASASSSLTFTVLICFIVLFCVVIVGSVALSSKTS